MIYLISDLHLSHNKDFLYKPRGFSSIEEMNKTIIYNINDKVESSDELYILGDLMLGGKDSFEKNCALVNSINCKNIHLLRGNHDTDARWSTYPLYLKNVIEYQNAIFLTYKKYHFYLSHFPTATTNYGDGKYPWQRLLCVSGHTHSNQIFDPIGSYNVSPEAHNNYPVSLDDIMLAFVDYYSPSLKKDR